MHVLKRHVLYVNVYSFTKVEPFIIMARLLVSSREPSLFTSSWRRGLRAYTIRTFYKAQHSSSAF